MRTWMAVAAAGLVLVAGCSAPRTVEVDLHAGSATLAAGQTLRIDLGEINESVGDSWHLVGPPDPTVLTERAKQYDTDCDQPGCGGRLAWTFTANRAGSTTLVFRYCYRSRPEACQAQPGRGPAEPVSLAVTVT